MSRNGIFKAQKSRNQAGLRENVIKDMYTISAVIKCIIIHDRAKMNEIILEFE